MEGLYLIHLVIAYKYTYNKKYINIEKKKNWRVQVLYIRMTTCKYN